MTNFERTQAATTELIRRGVPECCACQLIDVILHTLNEAEAEIRREERIRLTASVLAEALPAEVIARAAEIVCSREF